MFSASQQAQGGSPWAQKTTATPFGSQAGMQFGNPSMGASPATPAHGQPGLLQPQNAHAFTPQNRPQQQSMAPQTTPQWGQQTTLGTPQNQQNTSLFAGNAPYSPAPPQPLSAQPSPMQPGQAPVNYLPGYLSKMRGNERVCIMANVGKLVVAPSDRIGVPPSTGCRHFVGTAGRQRDPGERACRTERLAHEPLQLVVLQRVAARGR